MFVDPRIAGAARDTSIRARNSHTAPSHFAARLSWFCTAPNLQGEASRVILAWGWAQLGASSAGGGAPGLVGRAPRQVLK